ncbi:MAG: hypothetical protein ABUK01_18505, partial [Leptospirales bacterium]
VKEPKHNLSAHLKWGIEIKELEKEYKLNRIKYETFRDKMNQAFGKDLSSQIKMYFIADTGQKNTKKRFNYCGTEFYTLLVFYNNRLLYYILQTPELAKDVHYKSPDCFRNTIFGKDKMPDEWFNLARDIWHHMAVGRYGEDENSYFYQMISTGESKSPPDYYQYSYFLFDREQVDALLKTSRFLRSFEINRHPTRVFTSYFYR